MATLIAMAIVWEFMLASAASASVNLALKAIGLQPHDFLHDRNLVLFTLCGIGIWQSVGFNMVLFMAGPDRRSRRDLYEAAAVDGAGAAPRPLPHWSRGRCSAPVTLFVIVITAIRAFQVFDTVAGADRGRTEQGVRGAAATRSIPRPSATSASATRAALMVVFLVFVLALAAIKVFVLDRRVHYS